MPPVSKKQARLMDAAAHNPAFARKVGIPKRVAQEFSAKGAAYKKLPERKRSSPSRGSGER